MRSIDLVAGDVADADVDDRRDRDDRRAARTGPPSGATTGAARAPGGSTPCTARTSPRPRRRAGRRTGGSRGRRPRRCRRRRRSCSRRARARSRKTSSSDVSRVDRRCSGRPRSAMTSRSESRSASPSTVTSTRPSIDGRRAARPAPEPATSSGQPAPTSTVTRPVRSSSESVAPGDDEPAGVDHHDVVAHLLHVVEQVRGHQHRDAERAEAGDQGEHLLPAERIEPGRRLVEQDQLGVADERLGELGALAHAGREAADRAEAGLVEADEVEDVRRPLAGRTGRQPAQLAERGDDVGRRLVERQAVVLGHVAEPGAHADRVGWRRRCPQTSTRPSVGWASPSSRRNIVVLPAPLAPTSPTRPRGHSSVRPSSAVTPG